MKIGLYCFFVFVITVLRFNLYIESTITPLNYSWLGMAGIGGRIHHPYILFRSTANDELQD